MLWYCCCTRWMTCHLSFWRRCWWGPSWWCISETMRLMTTYIPLLMTTFHTSLPSSDVLNIDRLLCCRQSVGAGIKLWLAGHSHQHLHGWDTSWRNSSNVSAHTYITSVFMILLCKQQYNLLWWINSNHSDSKYWICVYTATQSNTLNVNNDKKLSYHRETARQLRMSF